MPHAIKLNAELADQGLVVMLSEVQGSSHDDLPQAMWRLFRDTGMRSSARISVPFATGRGIPACGIIGVDGTLLYAGSVGRLGSKMEDLIDGELKKLRTGWGSTADVRRARAAIHGKHRFADAKELCDEAIAAAPGQDGPDDEWRQVQKELENAYRWRIDAVRHHCEAGRWVEAKDLCKDLAKMVDGIAEWESNVDQLTAAFETPDAEAELGRARKVDRLLAAFAKRKLKGAEAAALRRVVKGAEDQSVGRRVAALCAAIDPGDD